MNDAIQQLIDGLNQDLAAEYQAVIMYQSYAAQVSGPHRPDLKAFFEGEIADELAHAAFLADKIVSLGGTPVMEARSVPAAADSREMLSNALAAEEETIERYMQRIGEAERAGQLAIKIGLENLVVDESQHRDDIRRILKGWR